MSYEDAALVEAAIRADLDQLVMSATTMFGPLGADGAKPTGKVAIDAAAWSAFVVKWGRLS